MDQTVHPCLFNCKIECIGILETQVFDCLSVIDQLLE